MPHSLKYWWPLNSVVHPQTDRKQIFVAPQACLPRSFAVCLLLEVLEQSHEFANLQEIKLAAF